MAFMTRDRGPLPPVILLLSILAELALDRWLPVADLWSSPWTIAGAVLVAVGIGIVVGPVLSFKRSDTTVIPFQESDSLVLDGMYKVTRNPMYLGMLSVLVGIAIMLGSLSPFVVPLLFVPVLNARVIRHEEVMLEERFGEQYRAYRQQVRRWL